MKAYWAAFRIRLIMGLQYRAAAWAGVCTQFFFGFVFVMIYDAFYQSAITPPSMPLNQVVSYLWLQQAFLAIIALWNQDSELLLSISTGDIAYELVRPYDLYSLWYVRLIAQRFSSAAMRCWPILLVAFFLPAPYNMRLPGSVLSFVAFVASMGLSLLLCVAISMFIYVLTFVTLSPRGVRLIVGVTTEFLAGSTIPIPLMPDSLQRVLYCLPFPYTADLPFRLYSGNIQGGEAVFGLAMQLVWVGALIALGKLSLNKVLGRVVVQGG